MARELGPAKIRPPPSPLPQLSTGKELSMAGCLLELSQSEQKKGTFLLLTVQAQPRTHPLLFTVLWMDFEGLGCRERMEWLTRPASASTEEELGAAAFFFQLSLLVVLETMPLTFSSE